MKKITVHSLIFALSNTLSNLILYVDSGDLDYHDQVGVTLEDNKLKVRRSEDIFTEADLS